MTHIQTKSKEEGAPESLDQDQRLIKTSECLELGIVVLGLQVVPDQDRGVLESVGHFSRNGDALGKTTSPSRRETSANQSPTSLENNGDAGESDSGRLRHEGALNRGIHFPQHARVHILPCRTHRLGGMAPPYLRTTHPRH